VTAVNTAERMLAIIPCSPGIKTYWATKICFSLTRRVVPSFIRS
jgi:hypothetical protein